VQVRKLSDKIFNVGFAFNNCKGRRYRLFLMLMSTRTGWRNLAMFAG